MTLKKFFFKAFGEPEITLLSNCGDTDKNLPRFLCDLCNTMPPTSGYEVIPNHAVFLIDEIQS